MAVLALAVPAWAEGPQKTWPVPRTIKVELSGYSVNLNPPAQPNPVRGLYLAQGRSSLGPVSSTDIGFVTGEVTFDLPEWCTGTVVFIPVAEAGHVGLRFAATGELLQLTNAVEGGICFDYMTNHYTGRTSGTVTAGSGRFHGAKGTWYSRLTGYCPDGTCTSLSPQTESLTIELEK
jgi:hypothetical protein